MRRNLVIAATLIVWSTFLLAQGPASSANLIVGTWKQNMAKSTYSPGPPPLKGSYSVRQYAAGDDGSIVAITINMDPDGLPSLGAISAANYDGREYAQHTVATLATSLGSHIAPQIDRTISYKFLDPDTVEIMQQQHGQTASPSTPTISRVGKLVTARLESP